MVTYVVLSNFTDQGIRTAKDSPKRADAFKQMAKTLGVTVKEIFWTEGRYDILTIVEAPDEASALSLNLSLGALGNVRTESLRAFLGSGDGDGCRQDDLTTDLTPRPLRLIADAGDYWIIRRLRMMTSVNV